VVARAFALRGTPQSSDPRPECHRAAGIATSFLPAEDGVGPGSGLGDRVGSETTAAMTASQAAAVHMDRAARARVLNGQAGAPVAPPSSTRSPQKAFCPGRLDGAPATLGRIGQGPSCAATRGRGPEATPARSIGWRRCVRSGERPGERRGGRATRRMGPGGRRTGGGRGHRSPASVGGGPGHDLGAPRRPGPAAGLGRVLGVVRRGGRLRRGGGARRRSPPSPHGGGPRGGRRARLAPADRGVPGAGGPGGIRALALRPPAVPAADPAGAAGGGRRAPAGRHTREEGPGRRPIIPMFDSSARPARPGRPAPPPVGGCGYGHSRDLRPHSAPATSPAMSPATSRRASS
jgi:hypothetical protein